MVNAVGKLIAAFVMLIVGVSLITVVSTQTNDITELASRTDTVNIAAARIAAGNINESIQFTLTNTGVNTWKFGYSECIPQTIVFKNNSGTTLTATTHYVYTPATATLTLVNGTTAYGQSSNTTTATFSYCPDGYVALGWGRTSLETSIGLFAIGLLLGAVALTVSVFREFGLG